jgi:hypothetical protein
MWIDASEKRSFTIQTIEVHWSQVPGRDAKLGKKKQLRTLPKNNLGKSLKLNLSVLRQHLFLVLNLRSFAFFEPIHQEECFDIYEQPKPR